LFFVIGGVVEVGGRGVSQRQNHRYKKTLVRRRSKMEDEEKRRKERGGEGEEAEDGEKKY
jgi:hypothetical protein